MKCAHFNFIFIFYFYWCKLCKLFFVKLVVSLAFSICSYVSMLWLGSFVLCANILDGNDYTWGIITVKLVEAHGRLMLCFILKQIKRRCAK